MGGDFVIQPVLKTGTSLGETIEITTKIEQILLDNFPEVDQVVGRIGAAEVPTDPMSMEESDVIIKLKPKSEWVSAESKDELADKFKEALSVIPGMEVEFTQPIEMRFNELILQVFRKIIENKVKLPVGYSVTYGGQFENLQSAKARLLIAVPIALVLIFILLHFAFASIKEAPWFILLYHFRQVLVFYCFGLEICRLVYRQVLVL